MAIEVAGLYHYPVKGLRGIALEQAVLTPTGLAWDRHWMIVMPNGRMVTQRQLPGLARISARLTERALVLSGEDAGSEVEVALATEASERHLERVAVTIWRDRVAALDEGATVSRWLTDTLQSRHPLRLVHIPRDGRRPQSSPDRFGAGNTTEFADAAPLLVTNVASLDALNEYLLETGMNAVSMERFRPNIVIRGLPAFSEYQQALLGGNRGEFAIRLCDPSERCIVTTIDQRTAAKDPSLEPLASLRALNTAPGLEGAYFGQNAMLRHGAGATLRVGDRLSLEPLPG